VQGEEGFDPRESIRRVMAGSGLSRDETEALFGELMDGRLSEPLKAALLVSLAMKGETADEIAGAAAAMRRRARAVPHRRPAAVDTCGTGGDGKGSFNISTAAALVAAAAGIPVAKHGNRAVSSRSGSADVLAALGVPVDQPPEAAGRTLDEIGIAFLFAPRLHPAMAQVMGVRRELGVRTIFNLLGPLTNPAGATRQVLGVYAGEWVEPLARVLKELGCRHALVVHGADGMDELSTTGATLVAELREGRIEEYTVEPEAVGLRRAAPESLRGGDAEENALLMQSILRGEKGPLREITLLNAAAAIYVGGGAGDLAEGLRVAGSAIDSGAARKKLEELRRFPHDTPVSGAESGG